MNGTAIRGTPVAPLRSIDAAEIAIRIRPLVPNRDAMFVEPLDVRFAAQEPEQFVDDRLQVQLLGREQRKGGRERKTRLRAEHGISARAGAIRLELSLFKDQSQKLLILGHRPRGRWVKRVKRLNG